MSDPRKGESQEAIAAQVSVRGDEIECGRETGTHCSGCACHEAHWQEQIAALRARCEAAEAERGEALDQAAMVAQGINHHPECPNCGGSDEEPCVRCQRDTAREHTIAERHWRREAGVALLAARCALEEIAGLTENIRKKADDGDMAWVSGTAEILRDRARAALAGGKE